MKTELPNEPTKTVFLQTVAVALAQLKQTLQREYEQAYSGYPDLHHLIHIVVESEEARARELTSFPHLLLPDLVEARLASLNLHRIRTNQGHVFAAEDFNADQAYEPAGVCCA
jgi:hypothetical protein